MKYCFKRIGKVDKTNYCSVISTTLLETRAGNSILNITKVTETISSMCYINFDRKTTPINRQFNFHLNEVFKDIQLQKICSH